jgi:chemotaxis protein MotA
MDIASIIGIVVVFGMTIYGISFPNLPAFINPPSFFITVGGSLGTVILAFPVSRLLNTINVTKNAFIVKQITPVETIKMLVAFAEQARREGILALEARAQEIKDEFLKKGIQLAVDGTEPDLIKDILSTEITFVEQRHEDGAKVLDLWSNTAPAFGMIGTLIGLVMMLRNMSDVSSIGPNMAVALITTFYGALLSYAVLQPLVNKLKLYSAQEVLIKELMLEGIMSLQSGDNPRIVEQKLVSFIEPSLRTQLQKERGGKTAEK